MYMPPETLRLLFENAPEYAIFMLDLQRRVLLWNTGAERLLGWSETEIVGQSCDLFFTPEDRAQGVPVSDEHAAMEHGRAEAERWHVRKDGSRFWGSAILFPVGDGDQRGYARVIRNRMDEYAAKQELKNTNYLLNAILDQSPDPITLKDTQGNYMLCNRAAAAIIGCPPEAILGCNDSEIRPPGMGQAMMQTDRDIMQSGESRQLESVVSQKGEERAFVIAKTPLRDSQQNLIGLLGIAHDITARNKDLTALQDRETRLSIAIDGAELGIFTWDIITRRAYWDNVRMYALFGRDPALGPYTREEFFGRVLHPDDAADYIRATSDSQTTGQTFHINCRITREDGQPAILRFSGRFELDADGTPLRYISVVADVTEAVQAENILRRHQEQIEALNSRLVRAMRETHHRIKNNLQVIQALIEIQAEEKGETEEMQRVKKHVSALAAIHDLLTLQIKQGGEDTHLPAKEVLRQLIARLQQTAAHRRVSAHIENIPLSVHQAASLALLINECVGNAIKHSKGAVEITLDVLNDMATLEVRDDGRGFPPGFDPRRHANTGLELIESAARWDLRGDVRFENRAEGGGRVVVTFPVIPPD